MFKLRKDLQIYKRFTHSLAQVRGLDQLVSVLENVLVVLLLDDGVGEDGSQILRDGPLPPEGDLEQEDHRQGHHRADHGPAHATHDSLQKRTKVESRPARVLDRRPTVP